MVKWSRREIENYLCFPETLVNYARGEGTYNLFSVNNEIIMRECIEYIIPPFAYEDRENRWWNDVKASDDYLDHVFEEYFKRLKLPNIMRKTNYHELARLTPVDLLSEEIREKLDLILEVAFKAQVTC